jgi:hypothetical protein
MYTICLSCQLQVLHTVKLPSNGDEKAIFVLHYVEELYVNVTCINILFLSNLHYVKIFGEYFVEGLLCMTKSSASANISRIENVCL